MSRSKRVATEEERALFQAVLGGGSTETEKPRKKSGATEPAAKPAKRPAPRARPTGVDGRTAERLRKGAIDPDATLDLHGFTEEAAHGAVADFLRNSIVRGARLLLVVTGKGAKASAPDAPFDLELERRSRGVLRSMVPRWLQEPALVHFVADVRTAHRRHGGSGALYVYLRKERRHT
jgi:DNA-nicking Smr family endonuclease